MYSPCKCKEHGIMVSPDHIDEQKPEEQKQPPVGEKKTRLSLEAAATTILVLLAIVVFIAAINFPSFTSFEKYNYNYFETFWSWYGGLVAFVAGLLGGVVKPYWSLLIVPISLLVGLLIGFASVGTIGVGYMYFLGFFYLLLFPVVAFFGAVIGIPIGLWSRRRLTK